jgi:hypothetical protein
MITRSVVTSSAIEVINVVFKTPRKRDRRSAEAPRKKASQSMSLPSGDT